MLKVSPVGCSRVWAAHYSVSTHSCLIILVKYGPACVQLILLREREKIRIRV